MQAVRIILADDHELIAKGLKDLLEQEGQWQVVGIANGGRQALSLIREKQPDLLISDLNMPDWDGFELIREVKARFPSIRVIVLSMYSAPKLFKKAIETGVDGYVLKEQSSEEVLTAIKMVMSGKPYSNPKLQANNGEQEPFTDSFQIRKNLTGRELEVLKLIAQSLSNKEIGERLFISEFTVQTHRRNLKRKLNAEKTADLVRFAIENGLV